MLRRPFGTRDGPPPAACMRGRKHMGMENEGVPADLSERLYGLLTAAADGTGVVRGLFVPQIFAELACDGDAYDEALRALGDRVLRLLVERSYEYRIGDGLRLPIPPEARLAPPPPPDRKRRRPPAQPRLRDDLTTPVLAAFAQAGVSLEDLRQPPVPGDHDRWQILAQGVVALIEDAIAELAGDGHRAVLGKRIGLDGPPLSRQATADSLAMQPGLVRSLEDNAIARLRDGAWPAAVALRIASHALLHYGSSRRSALDAATILHALQTHIDPDHPECSGTLTFMLARLAHYTRPEAKQLGDDVRVRHAEQRRERNLAVQFGQLIAGAWWPPAVNPSCTIGTTSARTVDPKNRIGSFESALNGRPIWFESFLERDTFRQLEAAASHIAEYREQPLSLPYIRDNVPHTYYPDVLLRLADGRGLLIEIKPAWQVFLYENVVKISHAMQWCERKGIGFAVSTDTDLAAFVRAALAREAHRTIADLVRDRRDVRYGTLRAALPNAKFADYAAAVLHAGVRWSMKPLALVAAASPDSVHFDRLRRLIACTGAVVS